MSCIICIADSRVAEYLVYKENAIKTLFLQNKKRDDGLYHGRKELPFAKTFCQSYINAKKVYRAAKNGKLSEPPLRSQEKRSNSGFDYEHLCHGNSS